MFTVSGMNVHPMALKKFTGKVRKLVAEKHSNVYCVVGIE
jgi:hypothetical protein